MKEIGTIFARTFSAVSLLDCCSFVVRVYDQTCSTHPTSVLNASALNYMGSAIPWTHTYWEQPQHLPSINLLGKSVLCYATHPPTLTSMAINPWLYIHCCENYKNKRLFHKTVRPLTWYSTWLSTPFMNDQLIFEVKAAISLHLTLDQKLN